MRKGAKEWVVGRPRQERGAGGACRVVFTIDGGECFFESATELSAAPEAALTALLFPAMRARAALRTAESVCAGWLENAGRCRALARAWWGFTGGELRCQTVRPAPSPVHRAEGCGLFFGGGVDSMYSLRRELSRLTHLIYIEGFDVPLEDRERLERVAERNRTIAGECGLELITLRTDLRRHPAFRKLSWANSFGGALAAVGHLLQERCSELLIPDDGQLQPIRRRALGIHEELTPLWSFPRVDFVHHDSRTSRKGKAAAIATWPLSHRYLRVCWEHRDRELNCGVCEKCLRTRLGLLVAGGLSQHETFPDAPIAPALDRVRYLSSNLAKYYEDLLDGLEDAAIRSALDRLFTRSRWRWPVKVFGVALSEGVKRLRYRLS